MVKKLGTLIILIVVALFNICLMFNPVYGADTVDQTIIGAKDFLKDGQTNQVNESGLKNVSDLIYNILLAAAIVLAVILGIVIGIQLMTASIEEKAKVKEFLMAYVVGCIVVFGAFGIWKIAVNILQNSNI